MSPGRRFGSAAPRALGVGALLAMLSACGPAEPYVRYQGHIAKPKANAQPEVYRTGPPADARDLGTVVVTCPSELETDAFGGAVNYGGCSYEWAVWQAGHRAAQAGADGIHSIETSVNAAGKVVSLRASAFIHARDLAAPARPQPASSDGDAPSVEERLRRLEKLKSDGLITPDEYAKKRAAILQDL
jgi:hypothetical protein